MPSSPAARIPEPMYATLGHSLPRSGSWTYEPKYDGMRVLADVSSRQVHLITRNGKEKSAQFPEVVAALRRLAKELKRSVLLDGEIVARPRKKRRGQPAASEFQQLQSRFHVKDPFDIELLAEETPATLAVFDLLRDGRTRLVREPWSTRRERLVALFDERSDDDAGLTLSESSSRGATMLARARRAGWEGIIAKRTDALYQPGVRSDDWLKLKLLFRAEFVIGGYTEPRNSRQHLGALLLGAHDDAGKFVYVGHTGGGFTHEGLREMAKRLEPLERAKSPFTVTPRTNEPAHWVTPKVIVEVKFAEWTADRLLRQPIYLGVRDDKKARDVTLEGVSVQRWGTGEIANDDA